MEILLTVLLYLNMLFVADDPLSNQALDQFGREIEPYYAELGIPTDTSDTTLHSLPAVYWGATVWNGRCTAQVYLSERFANTSHPFYSTPMWKYVMAHEWAHVAQGKHCWDNEAEAELIALTVLANAGEWGAVITALEWMFTLSVSDAELSQLYLSPQEEGYYLAVDLPQPGVVELLLEDDDGVFELSVGTLDAEKLWKFVKNLSGNGERIDYGKAR
ncbi:MAG: hypothetical protein ABUK20_13800 [Anaerolineales bacterium]